MLNTERCIERRRRDVSARSRLRPVPHQGPDGKDQDKDNGQTSFFAPMRPRWRPALCLVRIWNIESR